MAENSLLAMPRNGMGVAVHVALLWCAVVSALTLAVAAAFRHDSPHAEFTVLHAFDLASAALGLLVSVGGFLMARVDRVVNDDQTMGPFAGLAAALLTITLILSGASMGLFAELVHCCAGALSHLARATFALELLMLVSFLGALMLFGLAVRSAAANFPTPGTASIPNPPRKQQIN